MVQYVLPMEGIVQKLVHVFYKCGCVCAGQGVMVQYVLPMEGMVQKLVLLFYKCESVQDEG
jgi:hypothetical protein